MFGVARGGQRLCVRRSSWETDGDKILLGASLGLEALHAKRPGSTWEVCTSAPCSDAGRIHVPSVPCTSQLVAAYTAPD
ncbi:uncharacterized [Tachysurus ichikawai]